MFSIYTLRNPNLSLYTLKAYSGINVAKLASVVEEPLAPDMQKRATQATQGRGNFGMIVAIYLKIQAKRSIFTKPRPLLYLIL